MTFGPRNIKHKKALLLTPSHGRTAQSHTNVTKVPVCVVFPQLTSHGLKNHKVEALFTNPIHHDVQYVAVTFSGKIS